MTILSSDLAFKQSFPLKVQDLIKESNWCPIDLLIVSLRVMNLARKVYSDSR